MNQAEYRLQGAEVREAELVLLSTPQRAGSFRTGRRGVRQVLRHGQDVGPGGRRSGPTRGVQSVAAPRRREAPCPGELGAGPGGRDTPVGGCALLTLWGRCDGGRA